jgi:hypothetical protein
MEHAICARCIVGWVIAQDGWVIGSDDHAIALSMPHALLLWFDGLMFDDKPEMGTTALSG